MNEQEKQLLLKDLCARLPYRVKAQYFDVESEKYEIDTIDGIDLTGNPEILISQYSLKVDAVKPYLRLMSSMTEEEEIELRHIKQKVRFDDEFYLISDFFYSHHLDCRGLIIMGLALPATEEMYKI